MAYKLQTTRTAQWPLVAEFEFNVGDTITDVNGATITIGTTVASQVFNVCNLPAGARISSVAFYTITAFDGGTVAASLGDSGSATKWVNAADVKAQGVDAATITGANMVSDGKNVQLTLATGTSGSTAGKGLVRVEFTIPGRANETYPI